jgi:hypothetical protein
MEEKYVQKWLLFKIFKYFNVKSMIDYDYNMESWTYIYIY